MRCPACSASNRERARFCAECGTGLPALESPPTDAVKQRFCDLCGEPLRGNGPHICQAGRPLNGFFPDVRTVPLDGERKQITVLFADISGSTRLIAGLDPEDAWALLDPVIQIMIKAVVFYGGTVNQIQGDGIMALIGAPRALEDHALRGCYAALLMHQMIRQEFGPTGKIRLHIGIATGEALVGTIGSDLNQCYNAVGELIHLAARLQHMAKPEQTLCTDETLRQAGGFVASGQAMTVDVRGIGSAVRIGELLSATDRRSRFDPTVLGGLASCIGREAQLLTLQEASDHARNGSGQVVALMGEAGVGKSRLIWEQTRFLQLREWQILASAGLPFSDTALYQPISGLLRRYFRIEDSDDARSSRMKVVTRLLALDPELESIGSPIQFILGLEPAGRGWSALDPIARREAVRNAFVTLMLRLSNEFPLVLVIEDLHWIDNATQTALDLLVESMAGHRILLLVNYRPDYDPGWSLRPHFRQLDIQPLPAVDAWRLLRTMIGDEKTLAALGDELVARTGGNPFFLEETVRSLVDQNVISGAHGAYKLNGAVKPLRIPTSVRTVLAARIDRLTPEDKQLVQIAAVIGYSFSIPLLHAMFQSMPRNQIHLRLLRLADAGLILESHLNPELQYSFRHALTREVAHDALPEEHRRSVHATIVSAMEAVHASGLVEHADALAYHALHGEAWEKLLIYARHAGRRAASQSAYREAVQYFEHALSGLTKVVQSNEILETGIEIRFELRNALFPLGEVARDLDHMREAEAAATELRDLRRRAWITSYIARDLALLGLPDEALKVGTNALALAREAADHDLQVLTRSYVAQAHFAMGDFQRSAGILREILAEIASEPIDRRFGLPFPAQIAFRCWLIWGLSRLGAVEEVDEIWSELLRLTRLLDQPLGTTVAQYSRGLALVEREVLDEGIGFLEQALASCERWGLYAWFTNIASCLGIAYAKIGRTGRGLDLLRRAVARTRELRLMVNHAMEVAWLAEACSGAGLIEEAARWSREAVELARTHQERGNEAYALWVSAKVAIRTGDDRAGEWLESSLRIALEIGMEPVVSRCRDLMETMRLPRAHSSHHRHGSS